MQNNHEVQPIALSLFKLGACLIYEALVVIAISLMCVSIFVLLSGDATHGIRRYILQFFLLISVGVYFIWCWQKSGQTLAMQTWKLKLVRQDGHLLSLSMAISRFVLATVGLILFGFGFLWALIDRDRLFLHDRLLKNKIIYVPRNVAS